MADEERDELVSARYRELSGAEPPVRLDDAILAASRRAVSAGPSAAPRRAASSKRWAVPVSLAAAVMLSVMVTLNVQEERPDLVSPVPVEKAEPAKRDKAVAAEAPAVSQEAPKAAPAEAKDSVATTATPRPQQPDANVATPRGAVKPEPLKAAPREREAAARQRYAPDPAPSADVQRAPAVLGEAARGAGTGPVTASQAPAPGAPAPAAIPASPPAPAAPAKPAPPVAAAAPAPAAAESLAKRNMEGLRDSAGADTRLESRVDAQTPERQLERIAQLRREGNHAEADRLYAEFRQRYPGYRIPDEMLERIRSR